jgi:hypothetical protein
VKEMTVNELCKFLDPELNGERPVIVRRRLAGEHPELLEISTVIFTLERDTAEDIVVIECDQDG